MISPSSIPTRSAGVVFRKINNEYLLIPLTNDIADMNSLYRMNETGAFIWELIDGQRSISEITGMLTDEFDVEPAVAEYDVLSFFDEVKLFVQFR